MTLIRSYRRRAKAFVLVDMFESLAMKGLDVLKLAGHGKPTAAFGVPVASSYGAAARPEPLFTPK